MVKQTRKVDFAAVIAESRERRKKVRETIKQELMEIIGGDMVL